SVATAIMFSNQHPGSDISSYQARRSDTLT
ncbi:hypothetical protein V3C99_006871, partial [Haemonchus contortus]